MRFFKHLVIAGGLAAGAAAVPASAAVVICSGNNCVGTSENVLVTAQTNTLLGQTISGQTNNTNIGVIFSSTTDILRGDANGQADVGSTDGLLNSLTFALVPGFGFTSATFNLFPKPGNVANEATSVVISYWTPGLGMQTRSINTNGQNFLGISGNAGEIFTSVGFTGNPATTGIQDMRQLRLGGVQSLVPEPSTWALFILGFGVLGGAMRRRTRKFAEARAALA